MKKWIKINAFLLIFGIQAFAQPDTKNLMPVPLQMTWNDGKFPLNSDFLIVLDAEADSRITHAVDRFLRKLDNKTHLLISKKIYSSDSKKREKLLNIKFNRIGKLSPGETESYTLTVTPDIINLNAETDLGILHGLETILQLIESDNKQYFLPCVTIHDQPRFVWRGLLIDVCRHFSPIEVIKRNIDGMAMVKLNVLHLHLSEDQGFRVECSTFPKLHQLGSNGEYFTQQEIKEIIHYASERGIRVVPEFDVPGHATSWLVGYPELASAPGPYEIEKKFGVFDPVMNPTKKSTYKFLDKFINEMCGLFPDEYFHIGGDENNGNHWNENKEIQEFMNKNNLENNHELHNYFNKKINRIVVKNNKKMVGWDEILQPGLPSDAVIQSWRGKEGLQEAARKGYKVLLSNGYYIDLAQPAWKHYLNDPIPVGTSLTEEQQKLILGGEATMWAELVSPETIDSRIWPRTAAIAERLWSPQKVNDVKDMYRRLERIEIDLEQVGLMHLRNRDVMLRRLAGKKDIHSLQILIEVVEPLKDYARHSQGIEYNTDMPLTRMPDIATPDSKVARKFQELCEALVKQKDLTVINQIIEYLKLWIHNYDELNKIAANVTALRTWSEMALKLKEVSLIGMQSMDFMNRRQFVTQEWTNDSLEKLNAALEPIDESELVIVDSIIMLYQYALPN